MRVITYKPTTWFDLHPYIKAISQGGSITTAEFGAHTFYDVGILLKGTQGILDLSITSRGTGEAGRGTLKIKL